MNSKWGGKRKGAGRKKKDSEEKMKGYTFQLSLEEIDYIRTHIKENNQSENLRDILKEYKILKKQLAFSK